MEKLSVSIHIISLSLDGKRVSLDYKPVKTRIKLPACLAYGGNIRFWSGYEAQEDILKYFAANTLPAVESVCNALKSGNMRVEAINPIGGLKYEVF